MVTQIIAAYREAYSGLPTPIWMLSGALFINRFGTMVLPFLTLYLTKSLGFSNATAGFVVSIYGIGSVIGAYVGGRLTKPVGAIRLQVILLLMSVPIFVVIPFCTTFLSLAISVFLLSIFSEGVRPANATAITEYSSPELRTRSFALNRMALNLGISFGPAIGGLLIEFGFFWIFVADALTTACCAFALLYFFGFRTKSKFDSQATDSTATNESSNNNSPARDVNYLIYLFLTFACALVFFQFFTTYPLYLNEHYGLSEFRIGLIYAVNTIMIVFLEMLLVQRAKDWNLVLCVAWGCFLTCLGFGILPFSTAVWFCVLSAIILTIGEMLASPMSSSWVSQRSENRDTGSYMGWYTMSYSIAFIIGPAVGGLIYQSNKNMVFYLSMLVGILVLFGFLTLNKRLEREKAALAGNQ